MRIKAKSDYIPYTGDHNYPFPLGRVSTDYICIGSIALDRDGDGGQISEAQAKTIIAEAIMRGAVITIEFNHVEITLGEK